MQAVLISIQPGWCELIASGKKTIEVRKTAPKLETPFKVYIYETQGRTETPWVDEDGHEIFKGRGQVIGEFVCDSIGLYEYDQAFDESMGCYIDKYGYNIYYTDLGRTCLSYKEFESYGNTQNLYGWRISDLVIYDKPRELSEFSKYGFGHPVPLKRPPQSWMYVEVEG